MKQAVLLLFLVVFALAASVAVAQEATPEVPTFAAVSLGGDHWLDPFVISVAPGDSAQGDVVDASTLDPSCVGFVGSSPAITVNWTPPHDMGALRIFFLSTLDPTLVVVKPDGSYSCNDDFSPLNTNPAVTISDPEAGAYQIFVGTARKDAPSAPGFLVITSSEQTPDTIDLNKLLETPLRDVPLRLPLAVLLANRLPRVNGNTAKLSAGFEPVTADVRGGGGLAIFDIQLGNPTCTGFVDVIPEFVLNWADEPQSIRVLFEGDDDATLVIVGQDGRVFCNDDATPDNLNPAADIPVQEGRYLIYVGSDSPQTVLDGKLTITSDLSAEPAVLAPGDLPQ